MNDDTINRQAALDALEKIDCSDGVGISSLKCDAVDDAVTAINALPSAQRWIPCSERLPEDDKNVLVTDGEDFAVAYWRKDAQAWDACLHGWCDLYGLDVVAWMELPKPWEGEQNE